MVVTTRTLIWVGLVILLIALATLGTLITSAPPTPTAVALFIGYVGIGTFGLAMFLISLVQTLRSRPHPRGIVRQSTIAGLTVIALVILQYKNFLVLPLALAVVFLAVIIEVSIYLYMRHREQASRTATKVHTSSHTVAVHTRKAPTRRRKTQS